MYTDRSRTVSPDAAKIHATATRLAMLKCLLSRLIICGFIQVSRHFHWVGAVPSAVN
ncbi:hypothetical protein ACTXT7_012883 [Hymenolepis weldensis]